jgi:serine/threonine protein kinase
VYRYFIFGVRQSGMMTFMSRPSSVVADLNKDIIPTSRCLLDNLVHGIKFGQETSSSILSGFIYVSRYVRVLPLRLFEIPRLGPDFVMDAVIQTARGISFLHRRGYTHGNINPMTIAVHSSERGVCLKLISPVQTAIQQHEPYYRSPCQMDIDDGTCPRAPSRMDDMWAMGLIICFLQTRGMDMYTPFLSIMPTGSVNHIIRHTLLSLYDANRDSDSVNHLNRHAHLGVVNDDPYIRGNQQYQMIVDTLLTFVTDNALLCKLMRESLIFDPGRRQNIEYVLHTLLTGYVAKDEYFKLPSDLID